MKEPKIVAHRGFSEKFPENTLIAFHKALEDGADFIEGDFYITKDKYIVCIHDPTVKRISNNKSKLKVTKSTLKELKTIDSGSWKNPLYKDERIPTLEEILEIIPYQKGIFIDVKDPRIEFLDKLNEILSCDIISPEFICIISTDPMFLKKSKQYFSNIKTYWIFEWFLYRCMLPSNIKFNRIIETLYSIDADGININVKFKIDSNFVNKLNEMGFEVGVFNVEKEKDILELIHVGIDYITTDSPKRIKELILQITSNKN